MPSKITQFLKKKKFIWGAIILAILIISLFFIFSEKNPEYEIYQVQKGTIIKEVSVTGNVEPMSIVNLSFERTGRINKVAVNVGDKVSEGEVLASIDSSELIAQLEQAQASLSSQKAKLNQLIAGTRVEQIKIHEADLDKAQQDLQNYYASVIDIASDACSKANDAVLTQTINIYSNTDTDNPSLSFTVNDFQINVDASWQRNQVKYVLVDWKNEITNTKNNPTNANIDFLLQSSQKNLTSIRSFLNKTIEALNNSISVPATTLATYKTNTQTGLTNINSAITNINSQQQTIASQKFVVIRAQNQLELDKAGSTPEEITIQEALIKQAEANVENYQAQFSKTRIISPLNGVVTKIDIKVGEISSVSANAISLISNAKYQIKTNIPEADIASIKINDSAKITLDAFGDSIIFDAKVISIEPAQTMIEGLATYKTTLQFMGNEENIKPGMTANIDIKTDEKSDTLIVPFRVVKTLNGKRFIQIYNETTKSAEEIEIKIGLRGSDGNVEITEGLNEGDQVVISQ